MKDNLTDLASILAVSMLSDGEVGNEEMLLIDDLEHDTELPGLGAAIKQIVSMAHLFSDEQLTELLFSSASKFKSEDKPKVFEAAISTLLADGIITEDEISNILTIAEALEIPAEKAVARLLFQVQEKEGDLVVDVEETLEDYIVVGGKTRYTSWNSFQNMLVENNYPSELIDVLKQTREWTESTFGDKAIINYTPNFMTLACTHPISRAKTFCFARLKPNFIRFEYTGNVDDIKNYSDFSNKVQVGLIDYFNQLSEVKI
ncbi:MAG: hypothetical protein ACK5CY_03675 [Bacteroidia bacterium]|jgi:hypothetical protein